MSKESSYFLEAQTDNKRLARQHELIKHAMGGSLVLAPVDLKRPGVKVLDSGTADGIWIYDFLKQYPTVDSVVGTDIDDTRFPADLPGNVTLIKQDITKSWPETWKNSFDLVHQRLVLIGSRGDPQPFVKNLLELVKPGGWIQLIEAEQVIGESDGPAQKHFLQLMEAMVTFYGTPFHFVRDLLTHLKEAGFQKLGEMTIPFSQGASCPDSTLREQSIVSFLTALNGMVQFSKTFPPIEGLSKDDIETLPARCEAELRERGGYYPLRAIWGQKPLLLKEG